MRWLLSEVLLSEVEGLLKIRRLPWWLLSPLLYQIPKVRWLLSEVLLSEVEDIPERELQHSSNSAHRSNWSSPSCSPALHERYLNNTHMSIWKRPTIPPNATCLPRQIVALVSMLTTFKPIVLGRAWGGSFTKKKPIKQRKHSPRAANQCVAQTEFFGALPFSRSVWWGCFGDGWLCFRVALVMWNSVTWSSMMARGWLRGAGWLVAGVGWLVARYHVRSCDVMLCHVS